MCIPKYPNSPSTESPIIRCRIMSGEDNHFIFIYFFNDVMKFSSIRLKNLKVKPEKKNEESFNRQYGRFTLWYSREITGRWKITRVMMSLTMRSKMWKCHTTLGDSYDLIRWKNANQLSVDAVNFLAKYYLFVAYNLLTKYYLFNNSSICNCR